MTKIMTRILGGLKGNMDGFRNITKPIRFFFKNMAEKFFRTTQKFTAVMAYFFTKIQSLTKRSLGTFRLLHHTLVTSQYMMKSVFDGPIGALTRVWWDAGKFIGDFFCFAANTPVILHNGKTIPISQIKPGHILDKNNRVLGTLKVTSKNVEVYNYKNIMVSGSHLVYHENSWKRVEDIDNLEPIEFQEPYLFCLITSNNTIPTPFALFADFVETHNPLINSIINNMVLSHLNDNLSYLNKNHYYNNIDIYKYMQHNYVWGFAENTIIDLPKGQCKIQDLKIGDMISTGKIKGFFKHLHDNIQMYQYIKNYNSITVSGSQAVFEDGKWIRVHQSKYSRLITYKRIFVYHVITDSNLLESDGIRFTDYMESNDLKLNDKIDNLVTKYLNKTKIGEKNVTKSTVKSSKCF